MLALRTSKAGEADASVTQESHLLDPIIGVLSSRKIRRRNGQVRGKGDKDDGRCRLDAVPEEIETS